MDFEEYQKEARKTEVYPKGLNDWIYTSMALGGEVGEILNKLKKVIRDENSEISEEKREDLSYEIGDVLWYIAAFCTALNLNFDDIARKNLDKLKSRHERDKLKGSGDKR